VLLKKIIMTNIKNITLLPVLAGLMLLGGGVAGYATLASAENSAAIGVQKMGMRMMGEMKPHVDGLITAINGSTLTITADANHGGGIYTIIAGSATITKGGSTATLASFAIGDKVWAAGTINGTTVDATLVSDASGKGMGPGGRGGHGRGHGLMGEVSVISGSTITLIGKDGATYTVNAGTAKVQKMVAGALSDITVGDMIGVQGTVSGATVTATTIMDDVPAQ
ncbi:MAG: hypothetical protein ABL876_19055, partial [Chitinophagaceae bacterium]